MRINMVSESEISVRGHGVHTAYLELTRALQARDDCEVVVNRFFRPVHADIVHIHTIGLPSLAKLLFTRGKKVVSAHVVPASLVGSIAGAHIWLPLAKLYMKFFYSRADKVLAVSAMVAKVLENDLGIAPSRIGILYNTIDTQQYHTVASDKKAARKQLGFAADEHIIVGNGQIQPRKRFDSFVQVARDLPNYTFVWVGGIPFKNIGAEYKKMQQLMSDVPDNVRITGVIELEDVKAYLQASDVFMLPAEQENHPMAVIEAAAAGLPIVLRDIPEYNDTFRQDIVRAKNDQQFADAVQALISDKKLYKNYVSRSKKIAARFDSKTGAQRTMAVYEDLLA